MRRTTFIVTIAAVLSTACGKSPPPQAPAPQPALGNQRADAVKRYLVNKGIDAGRLSETSTGERAPLDAGRGEVAWAQNRRAEFVIMSADKPLAMRE